MNETKHRVVTTHDSMVVPVSARVMEDHLYPGRFIIEVRLAHHLVHDEARCMDEAAAVKHMEFHMKYWTRVAHSTLMAFSEMQSS
jgi:hypothetical protein